jgi:C4-type Zn-finger protein
MKRRDVCWLCGGTLIWGNDWNTEDFGYEGDGIVSTLHCSSCNAQVTYVLIEEEE